ncbi:DUF7003 family protein [Actinomadura sp. HBU206391]|uniref:DUF7003 family protein n=1 Tax=Actinomadura sp. HBU206391 TaxID=2731692 RepID=UPI001650CA60|nr:hypothetical protein [Actinomadura sp. HBU206391]MBC6456582.1 hypothetical protein [Actinomadura sp. HBU206391]
MDHDEGPLGPNLRAAINDAMLPVRDHRGLMPLDEARTRLSGLAVFRKGEGALVGGRFVLESDMTWAALLSLEGAEEFVGHARRLRWEFHVRGRDNLALTERYGDGVLPWIADRVDRNGMLHNVPWCVLPCLLASGAEQAYEIAARVRGVTESIDGGLFSPHHQDVEVLCQWITRHPERGHRLLAERAAAEDEIAQETIRTLHSTDPRGTTHRLTAAVGAAATEALLDRLALVTRSLPAAIQAALDAAPQVEAPPSDPLMIAELDEYSADFDFPIWDNTNYFCAAMRMTGFINPGGTDGLVFQSLVTGLGEENVRLELHRFGFGMTSGTIWDADSEILDEDEAGEIQRARSAGTVRLPNGHARVDLARDPDFGDHLGPLETLMLRLTDSRELCDRTFLSAEQLKEPLGLPAEARPLFTLDEWRHPGAGEPASDSEDLCLAVEALRSRRAISASLTGTSRDVPLRDRIGIIGGWGEAW